MRNKVIEGRKTSKKRAEEHRDNLEKMEGYKAAEAIGGFRCRCDSKKGFLNELCIKCKYNFCGICTAYDNKSEERMDASLY